MTDANTIETCTADHDNVQGASPAIHVSWVHDPRGDWFWDPRYLAHGGDLATSCT